ncbi:DUF6233 domain-containing protein [Streptomyces roseolus]|uniref:DUF6233 domain-containing protein n=1 Tax=Streptomyces roseolus TaxID=67358 RepID=UPI0037A15773
MHDTSHPDHRLPPDLPRLETLETYLSRELAAVRAKIERLRVEASASATRTPREAPPFVLSMLRAQGRPVPDSIHLPDCGMASKRVHPLTEEQARRAIAVDGIAACAFCRPDAELGILG